MIDEYVPDNSYISCNKASNPTVFKLKHAKQLTMYEGKLMGTELEKELPSMGICSVTGKTCVPAIQKWTRTQKNVRLGGNELLIMEKSEAQCSQGGVCKTFPNAAQATAYSGSNQTIPWYKKFANSLEKNGLKLLSFDAGVLKGEWNAVKKMGEGAVNVIEHPINTLSSALQGGKNIILQVADAASHPVQTASSAYESGKQVLTSAVDAVEHPVENVKKIGEAIYNNPSGSGEQVGEIIPILAITVATDGTGRVGVEAAEAGADAAEVETVGKVITKMEEIEDDDAALESEEGVKCSGTAVGEPVDPVTGFMYHMTTDFELAGPIPLQWEREYSSGTSHTGLLGRGVFSSFDITLLEKKDKLEIIHKNGMAFAVSLPCEKPVYHVAAQIKVEKNDDKDARYKVFMFRERLQYHFAEIESGVFKPVMITDERGFSINIEFSGKKLLSVTDSVGRILKVTSNVCHCITKVELIVNALPQILVEYEYDDQQNMIKVTDALKQNILMVYDHKNRMIQQTDRNGQSFYWKYNSRGQCIHTWGDGGWYDVRLEYLPYKTITTEEPSICEEYHYNEKYKLIRHTDAYGNSKLFDYNEKGLLTQTTDEEGIITRYKYDRLGNRIETEYADGTRISSLYDQQNRLILTTDLLGAQQAWVYDQCGRLSSYLSETKKLYFEYNSRNLVSKIQNDLDHEVVLEYDKFYNISSITDPDTGVLEYKYNIWGDCTEIKERNGNKQTMDYDKLRRVIQVIFPNLKTTTFQYDAYDVVVGTKTENEMTASFKHTPLGEIKEVQKNNVKMNFDYDAQERLKSASNGKGEKYHWIRNKRGEIIKEISFDGITKQYKRDRAGKIIQIDKPGNRSVYFQYDKGGRIIAADYHDGSRESFEYNAAGLLIRATTPDNEVSFIRDRTGKILQEIQGEHSIHYHYDKKGILVSVKSSLGADISYSNEDYGKKRIITAKSADAEWISEIKHKPKEKKIEQAFGGKLLNVWSEDLQKHTVRQYILCNQEENLSREYLLDSHQNIWKINNNLTGRCTEFGYDEFQRLTTALYEDGSRDDKFSDQGGCIFRTKNLKDRVYGKSGKLLKDEHWYYMYDEVGNLIKKTKKKPSNIIPNQQVMEGASASVRGYTNIFDEKAEIRRYSKAEIEKYKDFKTKIIIPNEKWNPGEWLYTWKANGLLKTIKKPDGISINFEYDAFGRRTSKTVTSASGSEVKIYHFVWSGDVVLHEWSSQENRQERGDKWDTDAENMDISNIITWVYENKKAFVPCAKIQGKKLYSIISDHVGRPIQVYNKEQKKIWEAHYDIFGRLKNLQGDVDLIPFRQLGQYEDKESEGLYYNRFRYYDSDQGGYISQDPIGLLGNNPTLYGYVKDSNSQTDPLGLVTLPTIPMNPMFAGDPGVIYLTPTQLAQLQVHFNNGALVDINNVPVRGEDLLFVMDGNGNMYVKNVTGLGNTFKHSSFLAGKPVAMAGEMNARNGGKEISTNPNSGHYRPSEEANKRFKEEFKRQRKCSRRCTIV